MSPALLSQRLRELEDAGVVERRGGPGRNSEYRLTAAGLELKPIILSLGQWGKRWASQRLDPGEYDPSLLMWDISRNVDVDRLPGDRRTVVQFDLSGVAREMRRWWLVVFERETDLCLKDPGHEVDIYVSGPVRTLTDVWQGRLSMNQAVDSKKLELQGPRRLTASFRKALKLSVFAPM